MKYIGTKTINAWPMTRLAYNELRGWTLPADENGEDEGFLVEYVDGGKANHKDYTGYISWSPADVFERSYKRAETYLDRMYIEYCELSNKHRQLKAFFATEQFAQLSSIEQSLLADQSKAMLDYRLVLADRLTFAGKTTTVS